MKRVEGYGPKDAEIVLVGEAPGAEEEHQGIPFVGQAGKFLDMLLEKAGIVRHRCYITNVVKIRPPNNDLTRLNELGLSLSDFIPEFKQELESLNPKVIVALGNVALSAMTWLTGIEKYRGSVLNDSEPYLVPTLHPSYIKQYGYNLHRVVIADLMKAARIASAGFTRTPRNFSVARTVPEVLEAVERCHAQGSFSYDIETRWGQVTCFGLGLSASEAVVIPFKNGYQNYWFESDELVVWEHLRRLMSSPDVLKIGHNAFRYDNIFLYRYWNGLPAPPWFDTLLGHAMIFPDLPHDLAFLTSIYTDQPYYKDDVKDISGKRLTVPMPILFEYNAKDCMVTYEIAYKEMEELRKLDMEPYTYGFIFPLYRALGEITQKGVLIDTERRDLLKTQYEQEINQLQAEIEAEVGHPLNVRSSAQMKKLLYETLKLKPKYDRKTKRLSTGEDALVELALETGNPLLNKILKLRSLKTLLSTFVDAGIDPDGRIRTSYGITETTRLSSTKTIFGTGANLQNIPKEYRVVFVADSGYSLTKCDKSQAEARAVAWLSNCRELKRLFTSGEDVFKYVAHIAFNVPIDQVDKKLRQEAKPVTHGSNYKMGPKLFSKYIGKSFKEGREIQNRYFSRFPEIRTWQNDIINQINKSGRIRTPFGRVRIFTGRYDERSYKEAIADSPQSIVVNDVNLGLLKLHYYLKELGPDAAFVVLQVHDEVVILHRTELRNEVVDLLRIVYSRPIYFGDDPLYIPVEIATGPDWYNMTEERRSA